MKLRAPLAVLLSWAILAVSTLSLHADPEPPPPYRAGFRSITREGLSACIGYLAAPERGGRLSGEQGYEAAVAYVERLLAESGIAGAIGGGYRQEFRLSARERQAGESFLEIRPAGDAPERIPLEGSFAVESSRDIHWRAPWFFAGYGRGADQDGPDDFLGIPPGESVVMIVPPRDGDPFGARGAIAAGARRIVVVSDERVESRTGLSGRPIGDAERIEEEELRESASRLGADIVYLSASVADRILERWSVKVEDLRAGRCRPRSLLLEGVDLELRIALRREEKLTCNVVGVLEGSDSALRDEYVVIGAHLDHIGERGEQVFAGADDNASGSAGVVAVAKAMAGLQKRPRRSIIFALFAGEELGLLGSRYFVRHSPVSLDKIVLMINLDMIGRNEGRDGTDTSGESPEDNVNSLHAVGSKRFSLELDPWIHRINGDVGLDFEYDEERVWERSDQLSFASRGVPAVFFFAGFHDDYHQPSDTADRINLEKVEKVCRLVLGLAFEVAERQERLIVNRI
ncbi:MAG: M28 family peptidase [Planctomycetes bacterium]|nr:M28 family peptidase [Planctomycetota bacterium]